MHYIYPNSDPTLALMSLISGWFTIAIAVLSFLEIMSPYSLSRKGAQCFIIVVLFFATLLLLTHAVWHLYTKEEPRSRRQGHLDWSWAIIPRERFQEDKQENDMAPARVGPWTWFREQVHKLFTTLVHEWQVMTLWTYRERCRWDISPMHKSPIRTGFDPPDVPHSLCIRILWSVGFFDWISRSAPKPAVNIS